MPYIIVRGLVEGICIGLGELMVRKAADVWKARQDAKALEFDLDEFTRSLNEWCNQNLTGIEWNY